MEESRLEMAQITRTGESEIGQVRLDEWAPSPFPQRGAPMDGNDPAMTSPVVDERWFSEWVAFGMLEIAVYLTKHAAFESYCKCRAAKPVS